MGCVASQEICVRYVIIDLATFDRISFDLKTTLRAHNYIKKFDADNQILIAIPYDYPDLMTQVLTEAYLPKDSVKVTTYQSQKVCCYTFWKKK
jgi:hypothetical protein